MNISRSVVHPVAELPPPAVNGNANNLPMFLRTKDWQGMPGTQGSLLLRLLQFVFAVISFCVLVITDEFPVVSAFRCLVLATGLQSVWSFSLAVLDIYAFMVGRRLQNYKILVFISIGDGISSIFTFAAACASAGMTVLLRCDMKLCSENPCARYESAEALAFINWLASSPLFVLNLWCVALHSR